MSFSPYMLACGWRFLTGGISMLDERDELELETGETSAGFN